MLNVQVIGLGAAGNKAVVELCKQDVVNQSQILLINTTAKDIPDGFKNDHTYCIIGDEIGGCGQERSKGKEVVIEALQNGTLNLDSFVQPTTDLIVLVTSTEGGTGSGSSVFVAKYLKEVLNQRVLVFAITGFENSGRAILNTVEFFKDMEDSYHVEVLCNKKFMSDARNNQLKAEQLANAELVRRFKVITGDVIKHSSQNIDDKDLKKLISQEGWGNIEFRQIDEKVKNTQQFNDILNDMIDESKSFDVSEPSQRKLGVIVSLDSKEQDAIDYSFNEVITKYGKPFEKFEHYQIAESDSDRFIAFITTGMHLPIDELEALYNEAQVATSSVVTDKDSFFDKVRTFDTDTSEFDFKEETGTQEQMIAAKNSFFAKFNTSSSSSSSESTTETTESKKAQSVRELNKNY
jgi:cell division GTPase FtsZ